METTEILQALFRWIHVVAGIMWIGHLYFFNFVNGPFEGTLDGAAKKTVVPQLRPRALYWFRWGAAWTWVTGVLLVLLVYYHGQQMFPPGTPWTAGALLMVAITFLAFLVYDPIARSVKDNRQMAGIGFVLLAIVILGYLYIGNYGYRATVIHTGTLLGTLMAANVWMRIWPAQKTIISAIRDGQATDPALVGMAGARSRHNTYMSVPLVWMMIAQHTTAFAGTMLWVTWFWLLVAIAVAWAVVVQLYKKGAALKGF
ncbi:MAG TPA: urate hydroxylase PuuD [Candidatus Binatia bacterium]|nr:urate hydroxylase PuuD [Candidatus Binatia bacterium]